MDKKHPVSILCMGAIFVGHVALIIAFSAAGEDESSVRAWFFTISLAAICNGLWVLYELYGYQHSGHGLASTLTATVVTAGLGAASVLIANLVLLQAGVFTYMTDVVAALGMFVAGIIVLISGLTQYFRLRPLLAHNPSGNCHGADSP